MTKYAAPSAIQFTLNMDQCNIMMTSKGSDDFTASYRKILANGDIPVLQVVEKDGHWFSINDARLHICRCLETEGLCKQVKLDFIPLSEIPVEVRNSMVVREGNILIRW